MNSTIKYLESRMAIVEANINAYYEEGQPELEADHIQILEERLDELDHLLWIEREFFGGA